MFLSILVNGADPDFLGVYYPVKRNEIYQGHKRALDVDRGDGLANRWESRMFRGNASCRVISFSETR